MIVALVRADLPAQDEMGDPTIVADLISTLALTLILGIVAGLIGVLLMTVAARVDRPTPVWFLNLSVIFAVAWLFLIPIGTAIGYLMLRWRSNSIRRVGAD